MASEKDEKTRKLSWTHSLKKQKGMGLSFDESDKLEDENIISLIERIINNSFDSSKTFKGLPQEGKCRSMTVRVTIPNVLVFITV